MDSFIIRRAAESNDILRQLKKMYNKVEGIGWMVEKVAPSSKRTVFTAEEIQKQLSDVAATTGNDVLKDAVDNMSVDELESVLSIFKPLYRERDNEITVYDNGKPALYEVEPELYKAIKGLNKQQSNFIIRVLNIPKRILQAGAVTTIDFMMRNMTRDTFTSLIQSETGLNPVDIFKGYYAAFKKNGMYKELLAAGGGSEYLNINERSEAQKIEDDLFGYGLSDKFARLIDTLNELKTNNNERTRAKAWSALQQVAVVPFGKIRDAVQWSELGPRLAEFEKALKQGMNKETAANMARQLSQDFLRHGYYGKEVNKVVAFFNANIQGTVRMVESFDFVHNPKKALRTLVRGFVYLTIPTIILYFFNHDDEDYKNLPEWRKAIFWNIPIGGGKFVPIPKPYGYGFIFGAIPEITLDKIFKDDPNTWTRIRDSFTKHFNLPWMPSAAGPIFDVARNKQWNGAPIENMADEKLPAYLRKNENTSIAAQTIGNIAKNADGMSPKQIDYLVKGYTGSVGDFFWRLPDKLKKWKDTPGDLTEYPIIKSFVVDSAYNSAAIDKLYDYGVELDSRLKELKETGKYPSIAHLQKDKQIQVFEMLEEARSNFNKLSRDFTEARKMMKAVDDNEKLSPTAKKLEKRKIQIKMNQLADRFVTTYEKFKQNNSIK
jgi:hypothetical protein